MCASLDSALFSSNVLCLCLKEPHYPYSNQKPQGYPQWEWENTYSHLPRIKNYFGKLQQFEEGKTTLSFHWQTAKALFFSTSLSSCLSPCLSRSLLVPFLLALWLLPLPASDFLGEVRQRLWVSHCWQRWLCLLLSAGSGSRPLCMSLSKTKPTPPFWCCSGLPKSVDYTPQNALKPTSFCSCSLALLEFRHYP